MYAVESTQGGLHLSQTEPAKEQDASRLNRHELLNLIDKYDNNETSKSITLDVEILDSFVLITKLHTKGEVNK